MPLNFFFAAVGLILLGITFFTPSYAQHQDSCVASTCGSIKNISYPFRLTTDPKQCGDPSYQLTCENNSTTILYLHSQKLRVQDIDYNNLTIRVVEDSINNHTCSFPRNSRYNLVKSDHKYPYEWGTDWSKVFETDRVVFWSCPRPQYNSFYAINVTHCIGGLNSFSRKYAYIRAGEKMRISDLGDMCTIDAVTFVALPPIYNKSMTLPEFHYYLHYGFELSWRPAYCGPKCTSDRGGLCHLNGTASKCIMLGDDKGGLCEWNGAAFICPPSNWFEHMTYIFGSYWPNGALVLIGAQTVLVSILALRTMIGVPLMAGFLIYKFRRRHISMFPNIEGFLQSENDLSPIRYSCSEIKKITKGFREKLGQGGFGTVYKGKLRSGRDVAVKVLSSKGRADDGQDFMNEISTIGRIHHVNVVKLVGYSFELSKRALVYNYMPNGSLEKYILGKEKADTLDWKKKLDIVVGVGRGIDYLHHGCKMQILHFDIKPHNILLDEDFTPKISDFGLARLYPTDHKTINLTAVRGTIGYLAPEMVNRYIGNVSYKSDIYSFGMMLIEMLGLNRGVEENSKGSSMYFPDCIYYHLDKRKHTEIRNVHEASTSKAGVGDDEDEKITRKMTIVALWCIQMSPENRPSMNQVVEMLEGDVGSLRVPPRPYSR